MIILYGYRGETLEGIADSITVGLNVKPELRESSFRGGDYWLFRDGDERAILQANHDGGHPNEPAEEAFSNWPVLLYLESSDANGMAMKLGECTIQPTLLAVKQL